MSTWSFEEGNKNKFSYKEKKTIYYVTNQQSLFAEYEEDRPFHFISIKESLDLLEPLQNVGLDSETLGVEVWQGQLLLLQLGNKDFQVVIDCLSVDVKKYKEYLESDRLFIIHNAKFDLRWLYKEHIVVRNVYDTFLGEKILYLGFPPGIVSLSLQACLDRHFNIFLDKSVRGQIYRGVTDEVIIYAANDVVHLEDLMNEQLRLLEVRGQLRAIDIENRFVRVLAYIEFMGIRLDVPRWKAKMARDQEILNESLSKLNQWVIDYVLENKPESITQITINKRGKKNKVKATPGVYVAIDQQLNLFEESKPQCIINWNSSKQTIPLFEELGFDVWTKDKGKLKKSSDIKLIQRQKHISDIVPLYVEYSKAYKVVTSFGQNFLDAINPITGRIHPTFNQMMDTGRLSCGSGKKGGSTKDDDEAEDSEVIPSKDKSVNIQQLPKDAETRACFIPDEGNLLIDSDYGDQEGHIFTELTQDKSWIEFYNDPKKRDGHSFVAKMIFASELKDIEEKDVAKLRPDLRQAAKPARFTFNYNGTPGALRGNTGKPIEFCEQCFNSYFSAFTGIKNYFRVQKRDMWKRGYILISELTGLRAYIYDWPVLKRVERRINLMSQDFWDLYRAAKSSGMVIDEVPNSVLHQLMKKFADGEDIDKIAGQYTYKEKKANKVETKYITINEETVVFKVYRQLSSRKSASENQSCNYPSQGTAAAMTKIAGILLFDYLIESGLIFKVFIPNDVHDEYLVEAPKEIAEHIAKKLSEFMEQAAAIFCKSVTIKAVPEIGTHWIH